MVVAVVCDLTSELCHFWATLSPAEGRGEEEGNNRWGVDGYTGRH